MVLICSILVHYALSSLVIICLFNANNRHHPLCNLSTAYISILYAKIITKVQSHPFNHLWTYLIDIIIIHPSDTTLSITLEQTMDKRRKMLLLLYSPSMLVDHSAQIQWLLSLATMTDLYHHHGQCRQYQW